MAGAHMFQAVQYSELDTLCLVPIRDLLKKRARYLRLVAQNNKADGVNVTPITVVASIDPELLENLIDMEEIDAESVDDCTDESVMEYFESTQERSASVTAEYVKTEVLAKVSFTLSENDPALRVTKAVADYYSLHSDVIQPMLCRPDQFSLTNSYVDDNSCWLVSSLPLYFYTMTSHRDIYINKCSGIITQCQRGVDTEAE
jgi:hypothetical protein